MTSLLAKEVLKKLRRVFPNTRITKEYYVNYKGQKLFFDFYLASLSIAVEVQGIQHMEFSPHFHGTAEVFKESKRRDKLKEEWCELNDTTLVCINHTEIPITENDLLHKIEESQQHGRED